MSALLRSPPCPDSALEQPREQPVARVAELLLAGQLGEVRLGDLDAVLDVALVLVAVVRGDVRSYMIATTSSCRMRLRMSQLQVPMIDNWWSTVTVLACRKPALYW